MKEEGVAAVDRALTIISAWRDGEGALPLRELHKRTGFYKSTILRLLASLERFGCVERQPNNTWALGSTLFQWGTLYQRSTILEPVVSQHLRRLAGTSGESTTFWVRRGDHRVCLFRADADWADPTIARPGDLRPVREGVSGAVLVANGLGLEDGVAAGTGCTTSGALAVSAPVFGPGGGLRGALTLLGPFERLHLRMDHIKPMVRNAAADMSRALRTSPDQ